MTACCVPMIAVSAQVFLFGNRVYGCNSATYFDLNYVIFRLFNNLKKNDEDNASLISSQS
jgi:hypothetical protein